MPNHPNHPRPRQTSSLSSQSGDNVPPPPSTRRHLLRRGNPAPADAKSLRLGSEVRFNGRVVPVFRSINYFHHRVSIHRACTFTIQCYMLVLYPEAPRRTLGLVDEQMKSCCTCIVILSVSEVRFGPVQGIFLRTENRTFSPVLTFSRT